MELSQPIQITHLGITTKTKFGEWVNPALQYGVEEMYEKNYIDIDINIDLPIAN